MRTPRNLARKGTRGLLSRPPQTRPLNRAPEPQKPKPRTKAKHKTPKGPVHFQRGRAPACGSKTKIMTLDPVDVSCKVCKITKAYRQARKKGPIDD